MPTVNITINPDTPSKLPDDGLRKFISGEPSNRILWSTEPAMESAHLLDLGIGANLPAVPIYVKAANAKSIKAVVSTFLDI